MGIPLYILTGCFTEISSVQLPQNPTSPLPAVACISIPNRPVDDLPSKMAHEHGFRYIQQ